MASHDIPVTVPDLLARVKQATGNIQKHRAAMAEVAAKARDMLPQPPAPEAEQ